MVTNTPMLEVYDLHTYYGKSRILHDVGMHIGEGETVAPFGRSGAGRSTLAKSIMGMVRHEGEALLHNKDVNGLRTFGVAYKGISYVSENRDISPTLTVRQNLLLGEKRNPGQPKSRWQAGDTYQTFLRLKERENITTGVLSDDEQQMLTLCRTPMGDPNFIIIDEPTEGLAPLVVTLVNEYLEMFKERGIFVLLVEQKLAIALNISRRVYAMGYGQVVFKGTSQQLKADAKIRQEWSEV